MITVDFNQSGIIYIATKSILYCLYVWMVSVSG